MKQTLTAVLLALTLLLSLTGCTRKDTGNSGDSSMPGNDMTQNGNTNNGTANGGTNADSGTTNPNARSRYGSGNSYGMPGSNDATDSESTDDFLSGRSYEQMLRDGRVNDTDGFLTDGENSVSRW